MNLECEVMSIKFEKISATIPSNNFVPTSALSFGHSNYTYVRLLEVDTAFDFFLPLQNYFCVSLPMVYITIYICSLMFS
jgi:hypothetical protein